MPRRRKPRTLQFETLEIKALLSTAHGHPALARPQHLAPQNVNLNASGGGLAISAARAGGSVRVSLAPPLVPPAPSSPDVTALQQVASASNLENYLTQLVALEGTRTDIKSFANQTLTADQTKDLQLNFLAHARGVVLPSGIAQADQPLATQFLSSLNTQNVDQTYLTTMIQAEQLEIGRLQALATTSTDTTIQQLAQTLLTSEQASLTQLQALLATPGTGTTPPPVTTTSPLSAGDQQYLQQAYSTNNLEILLGQTAALTSNLQPVQLYAQKLVADHQQARTQLETLALAYGVSLQPSLNATDQATARQVLQAVNTPNFEQTYLSTAVQTHEQDFAQNQQAINTLQNPNLKQVAIEDLPTDYLHLVGAQDLLNQGGAFGLLSLVTNVHQSVNHRGNGTLVYNLSFDSGGFRFNHQYRLNIHRLHGQNNVPPGINGVQSVQVFLFALQAQLNQLAMQQGQTGTGGVTTGTLPGSSTTTSTAMNV